MADIPKSVYLNAARAADEVGPKPFANYVERLAARPDFRAAVESVWESRGEHDAAVIRAYAAANDDGGREFVGLETAAELVEAAALDAQHPTEDAFAATIKRIEEQIRAARLPIPYLFAGPFGEVTSEWPKVHVTEAAGDKVYVVGRRQERNESFEDWVKAAVRAYPDRYRLLGGWPLDARPEGEGAAQYRWRVQFVSRGHADGEEWNQGRHDYEDNEEAAREYFDGEEVQSRVSEYWRIEVRRQRISDWETVEDTGYAPAALDARHPGAGEERTDG